MTICLEADSSCPTSFSHKITFAAMKRAKWAKNAVCGSSRSIHSSSSDLRLFHGIVSPRYTKNRSISCSRFSDLRMRWHEKGPDTVRHPALDLLASVKPPGTKASNLAILRLLSFLCLAFVQQGEKGGEFGGGGHTAVMPPELVALTRRLNLRTWALQALAMRRHAACSASLRNKAGFVASFHNSAISNGLTSRGHCFTLRYVRRKWRGVSHVIGSLAIVVSLLFRQFSSCGTGL